MGLPASPPSFRHNPRPSSTPPPAPPKRGRTLPLPFAEPLPLAGNDRMLSDAGKPQGRLISSGKLGRGLQLNISLLGSDSTPGKGSDEARGPPSPPLSPNHQSSQRFPISLDQDGRRVLRRCRSGSMGGASTSPPPSPTRRVKQRFGVGDDDADLGVDLARWRLPTPISPSTEGQSIFPLSSPQNLTAAAVLAPAASLRRASSLFRITSTLPLRRRSTTALFKPFSPPPPPELTRAATKPRGSSAGWKRELGVMSEEEMVATGGWTYEGGEPSGWSGGEGLGMLMVTNPDEERADEERAMDTEDPALGAMDNQKASDCVGVAL